MLADADRYRFFELARRWRAETGFYSNPERIMAHPAIVEIMAMGRDVAPLLFRELERRVDHWFTPLRRVLGTGPVIPYEHRGRVAEMRRIWLEWGRRHGYLPAEEPAG